MNLGRVYFNKFRNRESLIKIKSYKLKRVQWVTPPHSYKCKNELNDCKKNKNDHKYSDCAHYVLKLTLCVHINSVIYSWPLQGL